MASKKKSSGSAKKQPPKARRGTPKQKKPTTKQSTNKSRALKKQPSKKPARKPKRSNKPSATHKAQSRRPRTNDQEGGTEQKTTTPAPFHVNAAQIASFPEEKFKEFIKALLRSERLSLGLPDGGIVFGDEMKAADGGVDLLTDFLAESNRDKQSPERTFIPLGKTAWQLKAEKKAPGKAEFKKELGKPRVTQILSSGGSYVFLAQKPNTAPDQQEKERILKEAAEEIGLPSDRVHFYAQSALEDFARRYPSLARTFSTGGPNFFGALQAGSEWASRTAFETEFQAVEGRTQQVRAIQEWLATHPGPRRHLRVIGPPGVGKTRLVLEALRSIQALPLTVYAPGYAAIPPEFLSHFHEAGLECILVVDECRDEELERFLDSHGALLSKIRLITIGHFEDDIRKHFAPGSPLFVVTPLPEDAIEKVLASSRPTLQPDQRAWVASKTGGFVKLAELLADAAAAQPDIDLYTIDAIATIATYLSKRLGGPQQRDLLQALSLFTRIGLHGPVRSQYESIVTWVGINKIEADRAIKTAKEKNILAEAGLFVYVTPQMLAAWLASSLWKSSAERILQFLSDERNAELIELAAPRINKLSAVEPLQGYAAEALSRLLSSQGPFRDLEALENPSLARAFRKLARANQVLASHWLYQHSNGLPTESLVKLENGRREIMWLIPDLLWNPEAFDHTFRSLLRFALAENEPRYSNNATGILGSVFLIHLAPTKVPFVYRIELARSIFPGAGHKARRLLVEAVGNAFTVDEIGLVSPSDVELPGWEPETVQEEVACRREALRLVVEAMNDSDAEVRETASELILKNFRALTWRGLTQEALVALRKLLHSNTYLARARNALEISLAYDADKLSPSDANQLKQALAALPTDLLSRVLIAIGGWGVLKETARNKAEIPEQEAPESLARDILESPENERLVHAFFEKSARNPGPLAYALGKADTTLKLWPSFLAGSEATRNAWLCSIYADASVTANPNGPIEDWCIAALILDNDLHREISARALSAAPGLHIRVHALSEGLRSGKVRPEWVSGIIMGGWTRRASLPALEELLTSLVRLKTDAGISVALQATVQALHGKVAVSPDALCEIVVVSIGHLRGDKSWEWSEVASQIVDRFSLRIGLAILDAVSGDSDLNRSARDEVATVFEKCLRLERKALLESILSKLVVDGKYDYYILKLVEGVLLEYVDIDQMLEWAHSRGDAGQVVLAKLLQPAPTGETIKALVRFGAKSTLGSVLSAEYGSGSFYGDIATRTEELAEQAKRWVEDLKLPKAFRDWAEVTFQQEMASAKGWRDRSREEQLIDQLDEDA